MPESDLSAEMERVAAAVHYVIATTDAGRLGYVKLNRILWYADLKHNRSYGVSITGLRQYTRMLQGPMAREINQAVFRLIREGNVAERTVTEADYARREMISLAEPDVSAFTAEQIDILNEMITIVAPLSASELNQITRDDPLWQELNTRDAMLVATGSVMTRLPKLK